MKAKLAMALLPGKSKNHMLRKTLHNLRFISVLSYLRCCKELLRICFEHLKLNRVILQVAVHNVKSRAVASRMGMKLEGTLEDKWRTLWRAEGCVGPYACDVQYGLTQSEWRASMNSPKRTHTACMIRGY